MRILTGIDLPFSPSCGSMILCDDLYSNIPATDEVKFLALQSKEGKKWSKIKNVHLLKTKKETDEKKFDKYVLNLSSEINKHVKIFKPDIIHIQHLSFGMARAFSKIKLPKIAICHGTAVLSAINNKFHKKNITKILDSSQVVIFPTKNMLNDCKKIYKFSQKTKIIPWGIPDELFSFKQNRKYPIKNSLNLLYAGRLTENKGVDTIINALKLIDNRVQLTIIGNGDTLNKLKQITKKNKLDKKINFINFQKRKKLWEYFKKFNIIITPTKKIEAFCLTAIEAQAHGLPVIYSSTGGMKSAIGKSGIMFKAGDYNDLANKINYLISNNNLLSYYSNQSIINAKKYKISKTQKMFWDISRDILT